VNEHIAITAQIRSVSGPVDIRGYGLLLTWVLVSISLRSLAWPLKQPQ
jgi:hypothetical protein